MSCYCKRTLSSSLKFCLCLSDLINGISVLITEEDRKDRKQGKKTKFLFQQQNCLDAQEHFNSGIHSPPHYINVTLVAIIIINQINKHSSVLVLTTYHIEAFRQTGQHKHIFQVARSTLAPERHLKLSLDQQTIIECLVYTEELYKKDSHDQIITMV